MHVKLRHVDHSQYTRLSTQVTDQRVIQSKNNSQCWLCFSSLHPLDGEKTSANTSTTERKSPLPATIKQSNTFHLTEFWVLLLQTFVAPSVQDVVVYNRPHCEPGRWLIPFFFFQECKTSLPFNPKVQDESHFWHHNNKKTTISRFDIPAGFFSSCQASADESIWVVKTILCPVISNNGLLSRVSPPVSN